MIPEEMEIDQVRRRSSVESGLSPIKAIFWIGMALLALWFGAHIVGVIGRDRH